MWMFLFRRVLQSIPVIIGVALIALALTELSGDPTRALLGSRTSPEIVEKVKAFYGRDKPWHTRFLTYLSRLGQGDLGVSIANHGLPVTDLVVKGIGFTLKLALGAIIIAVSLGMLAGIFSAWRPNSWIDYAASGLAAIGISFPAFFLAMLFQKLFAVNLKWFPIGGYGEGQLEYLILPCLSLGLISTASIARLTRNCLLEANAQDYVRTGRAKGLGEWTTLLGHALPNALVPVVTVIGTDFAGLLTGAVLTETVYGLPGIGSVLSKAIFERDLPVVTGCCVVMALIFILANLVVDLLYALLDPRIRYAD